MKTFVVVALALVGSWAYGAAPMTTKDQLTTEMQQSLVSRDTATSDEVLGESFYDHDHGGWQCWAYTTCLNGYVVSCTSTGAACRSTAYPARGVVCEAWGGDGSYRYATSSCY